MRNKQATYCSACRPMLCLQLQTHLPCTHCVPLVLLPVPQVHPHPRPLQGQASFPVPLTCLLAVCHLLQGHAGSSSNLVHPTHPTCCCRTRPTWMATLGPIPLASHSKTRLAQLTKPPSLPWHSTLSQSSHTQHI